MFDGIDDADLRSIESGSVIDRPQLETGVNVTWIRRTAPRRTSCERSEVCGQCLIVESTNSGNA